jgi:hypothetical protein
METIIGKASKIYQCVLIAFSIQHSAITSLARNGQHPNLLEQLSAKLAAATTYWVDGLA